VARPQASRRDLDDLKHRLTHWLARHLPAAADPRIATLDVPASNGMSSETVLFDATWRVDGAARTESFVARVAPDPSAVPVFPTYDLDRQFRVVRLVGETSSVPVPRVFWSEPDAGPLGAPPHPGSDLASWTTMWPARRQRPRQASSATVVERTMSPPS